MSRKLSVGVLLFVFVISCSLKEQSLLLLKFRQFASSDPQHKKDEFDSSSLTFSFYDYNGTQVLKRQFKNLPASLWGVTSTHNGSDTFHRKEKNNRVNFTHLVQTYTPTDHDSSNWKLEYETWWISMKRALKMAKMQGINVQVLLVLFPEDALSSEMMERIVKGEEYEKSSSFYLGRILERGLLDVCNRTLPFFQDVIETAQIFGRGDAVVYTNADILLYPNFYIDLIKRVSGKDGNGNGGCSLGAHAYSFTRATLVDKFTRPEQYDEMVASRQIKGHPGTDCIVACKETFDHAFVGNVVLGAPPSGVAIHKIMLWKSGGVLKVDRNRTMTFHLGFGTKLWHRKRGKCSLSTEYNYQAESRAIRSFRGNRTQ